MSIGLLKGSTLMKFIEDKDVFENCLNEYFKLMDASGRGLSRDRFREGFHGFFIPEGDQPPSNEDSYRACDSVFERFDEDRNGNIDRKEFGLLMREIMLAIAHGLGNSIGLMYLDRDGLLSRAIKLELAKE